MVVAAVPSHERADRVAQRTIPLLRSLGVNEIHVFVTPGQEHEYRATVGDFASVHVGRSGNAENRNSAIDFFLPGTPVMMMDDDVSRIVVMDEGKFRAATADEFADLVRLGFGRLRELRGGVWGLNPSHNNLYARGAPRVRAGFPKLDTPVFGFIAGTPGVRFSEGEFIDVELAARLFSSGMNIIRFDRWSYIEATRAAGGRGTKPNACHEARELEYRYPRLLEHGFGKIRTASRCLPRPRRGLSVKDPSYEDLLELRWRIGSRPEPEVDSSIHSGWEK